MLIIESKKRILLDFRYYMLSQIFKIVDNLSKTIKKNKMPRKHSDTKIKFIKCVPKAL